MTIEEKVDKLNIDLDSLIASKNTLSSMFAEYRSEDFYNKKLLHCIPQTKNERLISLSSHNITPRIFYAYLEMLQGEHTEFLEQLLEAHKSQKA